jgi:cytochrome oxidase Cu insertion factor (SCO1/SenC/PrrC family)
MLSGTLQGGFHMKKAQAGLLAAVFLAAALAVPARAQAGNDNPAMPKVGDMAPDFTLKAFTGNELKDVKLSDYRGKKNVVLAFYVFAFTGG